MSQSRMGSITETLINVAIGFVISFGANLIILPMFGHGSPGFLNNLRMTAVFTVLSIVRGYVIRRWFNQRIVDLANKIVVAQ